MAYRIAFITDLFNGPSDTKESEEFLQDALVFLTKVDMRYLRMHPNTPLLHQSGVRYREENVGDEDWQDIPSCLRTGWADCEDLACWRAAELNVRQGIKAIPILSRRTLPNGNVVYHIRVKYPNPDGSGNAIIEDPSRDLGMTGPSNSLPYGAVIGTLRNLFRRA